MTPRQPAGPESGFALIGALLVMVLLTALGSGAMFLAQMDLMLAGNYRVQRVSEAAADGALELVKAMVFSNYSQLNLPLSIPANLNTARDWRAGADTNSDGVGDGTSYIDGDIRVAVTIKYKQEDTFNFNTAETYPDEVVRYGKDYGYTGAQKEVGKQPVFTVTFTDSRTGISGEADLISSIGFTTPAALFCGGTVHMQNYQWATEETVEVTSGSNTPAVATAASNANAITIETVQESTTYTGTTKLAAAATQNATTLTVLNAGAYLTAGFTCPCNIFLGSRIKSAASTTPVDHVRVTCALKTTTTTFTGCRELKADGTWAAGVPATAAGTFVNVQTKSPNPSVNLTNSSGGTTTYAVRPTYLHQRVYRPSEVTASKTAGLYNQARESEHILLGVGDRYADLDAAYTSGGSTAANALFRFYATGVDTPTAFDNTVTPHQCSGVVCYNYQMPAGGTPQERLEKMVGQSFAELKSLADKDCNRGAGKTCEFTTSEFQTVSTPTGSSNFGFNLSNLSLGTKDAPKVVYFNGTGNATPIVLKTDANTQVSGFGILIINGNVDIVGSINWTGLMLINGNLTFKPWQGGTNTARSGPDLKTRWNGFLVIGGNLDLWTYWGGSIVLGYNSNEAASIKGVISSTVPHKVLSWRRSYY